MRAYVMRRLLLMVPTLLGVTFIIFFGVTLVPGDVIDAMSQVPDIKLDRAAIERELGLDASLPVQYGRWMGFLPQMDGNFSGVFQGNLGESYFQKKSVVELMAISGPVTLELGLMGLIIGQLIALPIGIYSALRQDTWGDYISRSFAIVCISVPGFWLGTLVMVFPAIWWNYMPPLTLARLTEDPIGNLQMFIVPAIVLGMAHSGAGMRITRTQVLEVLRQDYIRAAWAKGLSERVVIIRHALKNALIPVVSGIGLQVPVLVGGTVIIEQIFNLPGTGRLIIDALLKRDNELLCGAILVFAVLLVLVNLAVDLTYGYLDPRVQYE